MFLTWFWNKAETFSDLFFLLLTNEVCATLEVHPETNFEATFHVNNSLRICFKHTSSPHMRKNMLFLSTIMRPRRWYSVSVVAFAVYSIDCSTFFPQNCCWILCAGSRVVSWIRMSYPYFIRCRLCFSRPFSIQAEPACRNTVVVPFSLVCNFTLVQGQSILIAVCSIMAKLIVYNSQYT